MTIDIISPGAPQGRITTGGNPGAGVDQLNQGVAQVARGVGRLDAQLAEKRRFDDEVKATKAISDARSFWAKEEQRREEAIEGDGVNYATAMDTDFNTYVEEHVGMLTGDEAKARYLNTMAEYGGRLSARAMAYEAATRVSYRSDMMDASLKQEANQVLGNPAGFDDALANMSVLAENSGLGGKDKRRLNNAIHETLAVAAIQGSMRTDPVGAMNDLLSGRWDKYLSPERKAVLLNQTRPHAGRAIGASAHADAAGKVSAMFASDDTGTIVEAVMGTLVKRESAGDPKAESHKGAARLAQIMPGTARYIAGKMSLPGFPKGGSDAAVKAWLKANPETNVEMGKFYLGEQLTRYGNNVAMALAAYNAGPGAVDKWIKRFGDPNKGEITTAKWAAAIPFKETREYVAWITGRLGEGGAALAVSEIKDPVVRRAAESEVASLDAKDAARKSAYMVGYDDYVTALRNGAGSVDAVPAYTRSELLRNLGPIKGQEAYDQVQRAAYEGELFNSIRTATPEDIAAQRRALVARKDEPAGFADRKDLLRTYDTIWQRRTDALRKDAAAYTLSAFEDVAEAAKRIDDDPVGYSRAMLAAQTRLGVPERLQRVMTVDQATSMVADFASTPSEAMGGKLASLADQWGDAWPGVLRDLRGADMNPGDYVAASYAASDPALAQQIVAASRVGERELAKGLDPAVVNTVNLSIDSELEDWRRAFAAGSVPGEAVEDWNRVRTAMRAWVMGQMTYGGVSESNAVSNAVEKFMSSKFLDPIEDDHVHALVPTTWDGTPLSEGKVEAVIDAVFTEDVIRKFGPVIIGPASPIAMDRTISTAINSGRWVVNDLGDGLQLMVPTTDGVMLPLVNADGEPFEIGYSDVAKAPDDGGDGVLPFLAAGSPFGAVAVAIEALR